MSSCFNQDSGHRKNKPASSPKKSKSPFRWLLMIPIQLIIYVLSFLIGLRADIMYWQYVYATRPPDAEPGHGGPFFSILIPLLGTGMTIVVTVLSIIITIVAACLRWKRKRDSQC